MTEPLYPKAILHHARHPAGVGLPAHANARAARDNPLCGDRIQLGLVLGGTQIADAGFEARGCALSLAAASLMVTAIKGMPVADARALCTEFLSLVAARAEAWPTSLGELTALAAVVHYPARIGCACLAWQALADALDHGCRNGACGSSA